jgi:hypothetical protein
LRGSGFGVAPRRLRQGEASLCWNFLGGFALPLTGQQISQLLDESIRDLLASSRSPRVRSCQTLPYFVV